MRTLKELERRIKELERKCCCNEPGGSVLLYDNAVDFPETGESKNLYIDLEMGYSYIWNEHDYELAGDGQEPLGLLYTYLTDINLVANTPYVFVHGLNLSGPGAYIISVKDATGHPLDVDYHATDNNTIEIVSTIDSSNSSITIIGI